MIGLVDSFVAMMDFVYAELGSDQPGEDPCVAFASSGWARARFCDSICCLLLGSCTESSQVLALIAASTELSLPIPPPIEIFKPSVMQHIIGGLGGVHC